VCQQFKLRKKLLMEIFQLDQPDLAFGRQSPSTDLRRKTAGESRRLELKLAPDGSKDHLLGSLIFARVVRLDLLSQSSRVDSRARHNGMTKGATRIDHYRPKLRTRIRQANEPEEPVGNPATVTVESLEMFPEQRAHFKLAVLRDIHGLPALDHEEEAGRTVGAIAAPLTYQQ
jgi:hypothetical protein